MGLFNRGEKHDRTPDHDRDSANGHEYEWTEDLRRREGDSLPDSTPDPDPAPKVETLPAMEEAAPDPTPKVETLPAMEETPPDPAPKVETPPDAEKAPPEEGWRPADPGAPLAETRAADQPSEAAPQRPPASSVPVNPPSP